MSVRADLPVACFLGDARLGQGPLAEVLPQILAAARADEPQPVIFNLADGRAVDLDLRGGAEDVLARLEATPAAEKRGPGRPKLGVTAREVTLLPRHWDWLSTQPGGASVALRKLVEAQMKAGEGPVRARRAKEATYRFITAMAGDRAGYEEATRMLFAGDWTAFDAAVKGWPEGVRETARAMAAAAWRNGAAA